VDLCGVTPAGTIETSNGSHRSRPVESAEPTIRMACINVLEAIVDKVPDAIGYLSQATGPAAPFEEPSREISRSRPFPQVDSRAVPLPVAAGRRRTPASVMR
jgi:hypothetical protein